MHLNFQYLQFSTKVLRIDIYQQKITIEKGGMSNPWIKYQHNFQDPIIKLSNKKLSSTQQNNNIYRDRFVPEIIKKNLFKSRVELDEKEDNLSPPQPSLNETIRKKEQKKIYNKLLCSSINKQCHNLLRDCYQPKNIKNGYLINLQSGLSDDYQITRCIPHRPYKILDAPKLKDDFYTNLLDWSKDDIISVVLDNAVYIWTGKGLDACKLTEGFVSCVKWAKGLVLGQETGRIRIIDVERKKQASQYKIHVGRVGCIDSYSNLIVSGSKDSSMMIWDSRINTTISKFEGHKQEICGVKWSTDGTLIASGGNDNLVSIWSLRMNKIMAKFTEHTAAVKALAWSPHKNSLLATGGGSTDKTIKLWDINQLKCTKSVDTGSQVCNMAFSISTNELISTHGYSLNSIAIWKVKNMQKIATLQGHSYRVLYLAKSPDEQTILTGSGDQTLRFWKIFPSPKIQGQIMSSLESKDYIIR